MRTIRQTVFIRGVDPRTLYDTLLDSRKHAKVIGAPARISRKVGGAWSAFDGGLSGTHLELVPGRRIVQTWRDRDWPEGVVSTVTFTFARVRGGARLTLRHVGLPDERAHEYRQGWIEYYWKPMKKVLVG